MKKRILLLAAAQAFTVTIPMATHAHAQGAQLEVAPAKDATVTVAPAVAGNDVHPASDAHLGTAGVKPPLRVEPGPPGFVPLPG